ncbi:hypothetical protein BDP67DRAFT_538700 [Colletotrichum lupini]|nr:hypothetical protein BDP67DRAFT_538700 [Colletotrichum lupini]
MVSFFQSASPPRLGLLITWWPCIMRPYQHAKVLPTGPACWAATTIPDRSSVHQPIEIWPLHLLAAIELNNKSYQ